MHRGRALVELQALIANGGDRIAFHLDAEPDRNKFDLNARAISPADGLLPAMIGTKRAINLAVAGKGSWARWRGTASLDLSGRPTARLALGVDNGLYRLEGKWAPAPFLTGKLQRLTVPAVTIRGLGHAQGPHPRRAARGRVAAASGGREGGARPRQQPLPAHAIGDRSPQDDGAVPEHDGQERAHGVDARRALRDRRLFVPADLRICEVRRDGVHGASCRGPRSPQPVADARSDPAGGSRHHWNRRCRRGDAGQPQDRRLADDHAQAGARRRLAAHQCQVDGQAFPSDRPRDRPVRSSAFGRDAALSDPGPRDRRRDDRSEGRARPGEARARTWSEPPRRGSAAWTTASSVS